MAYATDPIAKTLREARARKGLSQRELSAMAGVPQGHISKIETGAVDLRLSSLVELVRALDLELMLVPRNTVPAVNSIVRTTTSNTSVESGTVRKTQHELARLRQAIDQLPRTLPEDESARIRRLAHELQIFPRLSQSELQTIRNVTREMRAFLAHPENRRLIQHAAKNLQQLRNHLAHPKVEEPAPARPAYSLDEDDNA